MLKKNAKSQMDVRDYCQLSEKALQTSQEYLS
jgi:hypothetical protein